MVLLLVVWALIAAAWLLFDGKWPVLVIIVGVGIAGWLYWKFGPTQENVRIREYKRRWNPEAVLRRRLHQERVFGPGSLSRSPGLGTTVVGAGDGRYTGLVVTTTGKEIWRCSHQHKRQHRRRRPPLPDVYLPSYRASHYESVVAAQQCADNHLAQHRMELELLASKATRRSRSSRASTVRRRPPIEAAGDETLRDLSNAFRGKCAYCGVARGEHLDHVIPVAVGGSNSYDNVLPACRRCNLANGSSRMPDFVARMPSLGIERAPWWSVVLDG